MVCVFLKDSAGIARRTRIALQGPHVSKGDAKGRQGDSLEDGVFVILEWDPAGIRISAKQEAQVGHVRHLEIVLQELDAKMASAFLERKGRIVFTTASANLRSSASIGNASDGAIWSRF